MVGLSDIPCVGKIVDRISDAIVDPLFRGFYYMFCHKDLANVLDSEMGKLNIQNDRVSRKVVAGKDDGKTIEEHVLKWQREVEEIQESAKDFSERYKRRSSWRCIQCLPIPRPVSRFQLGREATQKTKRVSELSDTGKDFLANEIAYLPPSENLPTTDTDFHNFESRKVAYKKLWEALVDEGSSPVLGIYGMPGVGKTRMMEQLWKEVKEKKIFDKIARADVGSDQLDVIKLQNQIAGHLNCNFESQDNVDHRAFQLKNSLLKGGKILIILDDVWRDIPIDIIGIPLGDGSSSKGFKILLTSREEGVCLRNNCMYPIKITTLAVDEAWALFKNTVGTSKIDSLQDESLARKVCNQCAGLPLLIRAAGKALQFTSHNVWKDALGQLERGKFENIVGLDPQVSACVQFSIDRLPDDAKSCLFLCSLYPEDAVIYIRKLIQLATGSQLVPDGESRVCAMVDTLKSSSLLLDCDDDCKMKLHDLIRDVARSIAVRDPRYAFLPVRCGTRLLDNADYCTRKLLQLHLEKRDFRFPAGVVCPDLHCLWLICHRNIQQFSRGFFSIFVNLKFLLIQDMVSSLEQQCSLQPLDQLRTLILDHCNMTHICQKTDGFFPENLETLCIWDCELPKPLDLPNLKYLKKLEIEVFNYDIVVEMVQNTISNLSSLEELHIPSGFKIQDDGSERSADAVSEPVLVEISKLNILRSMRLFLRYLEPFQDTNVFGNLLDFEICVGNPHGNFHYKLHSSVSCKRVIELHGNQFKVLERLIERAEVVGLWDCTDVNMSTIYNNNREAFADLSVLSITNCNTMGHLARISQDEILRSPKLRTSFSKLISLTISQCSSIKYLFNSSAAKCLMQLQELEITGCLDMETIIMNDGTNDGDIIDFTKLKSLELSSLPRLTSFYREEKDMQHSSSTSIMDESTFHSVQSQPLFDGMVAFSSVEVFRIYKIKDIREIWGKYYYNERVSCFTKLRSLEVDSCNKLETVIPRAMFNRLQNLEDVEIIDCNHVRNVFVQSLVARDLMHLKKMIVRDCEMLEEVIGASEQEEITDGVIFPELTTLELLDLPNLTSFWRNQSSEANNPKVSFPNLVDFELKCVDINLEAIELGRDDSTCQLKSLYISCDPGIQLPSRWKPQLCNLKRLSMGHCWPRELKYLFYRRLKVLNVQNCRCSTLFTFSAFKNLQFLQELEISGCAILEEIVEDARGEKASGMDKETITLSRLRSVTLTDLPNLKTFLQCRNYECHLPALQYLHVDNCGISTLFTCSASRSLQQLQNLKISNCGLLETIVEDAKDGEFLGMQMNKTMFFQLTSITLDDLPNLKSFFHCEEHESCMSDIRGVYTLFTCSAFRKFPHLTELTVSNCRLLVSIVADVRDDEIPVRNDKIFIVDHLWLLVLKDLPNLKSFSSSSSYAFSMPKLYRFVMHGCPQMEYFTYLETSTSMVFVHTELNRYGETVPDLNDYIRRNCERGSNSSDEAGERICGNQEGATESERVSVEQLLENEDDKL